MKGTSYESHALILSCNYFQVLVIRIFSDSIRSCRFAVEIRNFSNFLLHIFFYMIGGFLFMNLIGDLFIRAHEVDIRSYIRISARDQPGGRSFDPRTCFDPRKFWISQFFSLKYFWKIRKKLRFWIFAGAIFSSFSSKITPWRGSFMNVQPI